MSETSEQQTTVSTLLPPAASPSTCSRPRSVFLHYPVLGLLMGGLWAYNHGDSLWEHTERLLLVVVTVPPLLERVRTRRRRRLGREGEPHVSMWRLTLLKLGVVALALIATCLLRERVPDADYWTAAGMALFVSVAGPALHPWMITRKRPAPRRSDPAGRD
ncbi:hypothetical protein [Streptomyces sp. NPDC006285]|uniref:hypothetical protein n=1 Tax=Streptomyces sp. NPDC006285 TaxID=3364742 RepID=UPI003692B5DE